MEKICGFKGLDGSFYEKEKECEQADLAYKVRVIQTNLTTMAYRLRIALIKAGVHSLETEQLALDVISKHILQNSDILLKVIEEAKSLQEELDELQKLQKGSKWWLNLAWWRK